jgi:hypothetical protein
VLRAAQHVPAVSCLLLQLLQLLLAVLAACSLKAAGREGTLFSSDDRKSTTQCSCSTALETVALSSLLLSLLLYGG